MQRTGRRTSTTGPTIILALILCQIPVHLWQGLSSTALPAIVGDLGSQSQLDWVASYMLVASAIATPIWGKLGDRHSGRLLMQAALGMFAVATAAVGVATNFAVLAIGSAVQGVGLGGVLVVAQVLLAHSFSARKRAAYAGYLGISFGVAAILAPLIGGRLVDGPGWRWCCALAAALCLLAIPLISTLGTDNRVGSTPMSMDYLGVIALSVTILALMTLLNLGGRILPWRSPWIALTLACIIISASVFVLHQLRTSNPLIPLTLFKRRNFALANIAALCVAFALFGCTTYLPQYLQIAQQRSATFAGATLVPNMVGTVIASILTGAAVARWGRWKRYPVAGLVCIATACFLMAQQVGSNPHSTIIAICMALIGIGVGSSLTILTVVVQQTSGEAYQGASTSVFSFARTLGSTLGVAVLGATLFAVVESRVNMALGATSLQLGDQLGSSQQIEALPEPARSVVHQAFTDGFQVVCVVAGCAALLGLASVLALGKTSLSTGDQENTP